jgi:hypothetical protein
MPDGALEELIADGLVATGSGGPRTTRRWQGAMARAALRLRAAGDRSEDLRVPIAFALLELHADADDAAIARWVEAMLPVEAAELAGGAR